MGLFGKIAGSFVKTRVTNTKTAIELIIDDFKKYVLILKYVFLGFSVGTIAYSLLTGVGNNIINISLLGLLLVYTILDAILKRKEVEDISRKIKVGYAWMKILLNAAALGTSLYTLYSATGGDVKPLSIVLATLSLIMFILKVVAEIIGEIIANKWRLLKTGMILDAQEYPNTSGKIFQPIIGELVDDPKLKKADVNRIKENQAPNIVEEVIDVVKDVTSEK